MKLKFGTLAEENNLLNFDFFEYQSIYNEKQHQMLLYERIKFNNELFVKRKARNSFVVYIIFSKKKIKVKIFFLCNKNRMKGIGCGLFHGF